MTDKKQRAVRRVIDHLESLKENGQTTIEVDFDAVRDLRLPSKARPAPVKPAPPPPPPRTPAEAAAEKALAAIAARIAACTQCGLCHTRTRTVPGQGHPQPEILFIGEGPGADEDQQGLAFVGRAGQLLTQIIEAMGLTRDEVFIGNIVKCRPPDNRVPEPDEMAACIPYLHEQIDLLKPKVIIALGATACRGLFGDQIPGITKFRGGWQTFRGIDVMPTYHPAYLLRNPPMKRDAWTDMKTVLAKLGRTPPPRKTT